MKTYRHDSSTELYEALHYHLSIWVKYSLENGFEVDPMDHGYARGLIEIVDLMKELEQKMEK